MVVNKKINKYLQDIEAKLKQELELSLKELEKELEKKIDEKETWVPEDIIKSKLLNIEIATNDYWELSDEDSAMVVDGKKKYFTWDEAKEIEDKLNNGWRLPTRHEWVILAEEFIQSDGELDSEKAEGLLGLKKSGGVYGGSVNYLASDGYYWSSTAYSGTLAYYLSFNSSDVDPQNYDSKSYGFSVRLVRDLGEEK